MFKMFVFIISTVYYYHSFLILFPIIHFFVSNKEVLNDTWIAEQEKHLHHNLFVLLQLNVPLWSLHSCPGWSWGCCDRNHSTKFLCPWNLICRGSHTICTVCLLLALCFSNIRVFSRTCSFYMVSYQWKEIYIKILKKKEVEQSRALYCLSHFMFVKHLVTLTFFSFYQRYMFADYHCL